MSAAESLGKGGRVFVWVEEHSGCNGRWPLRREEPGTDRRRESQIGEGAEEHTAVCRVRAIPCEPTAMWMGHAHWHERRRAAVRMRVEHVRRRMRQRTAAPALPCVVGEAAPGATAKAPTLTRRCVVGVVIVVRVRV